MESTQVKPFCKFCTKEIPPAATRCPNCHGDLRSWPARHKILTALGVLILLSVILAATGDGKTEDASTVGATDSAKNEEVIVISAYALSQEYDANKVAADAKYKDKVLEMSGVIDEVGKDILDAPYVKLEGINMFAGVQCFFSTSDEPLLAELSEGQSITLRGRVSSELIGSVIVKGCKIVE